MGRGGKFLERDENITVRVTALSLCSFALFVRRMRGVGGEGWIGECIGESSSKRLGFYIDGKERKRSCRLGLFSNSSALSRDPPLRAMSYLTLSFSYYVSIYPLIIH
jgi:hypothetical protein